MCNDISLWFYIRLVAQSCLTLCNPMTCITHQAPRWNSPGRITRVGNHSLLQGIFLTQESNLGLPHCQQILYHLNHEGSSLMYIDLMINDIEHWYVLFWKTSIERHCPFFRRLPIFLFLSCLNFLLILDSNLFLDA